MLSPKAACEVLGLEPGSTSAEIKKAYRRLVMEFHPDRRGADEEAARRLREVNQAYDVLSRGPAADASTPRGERDVAEWEPVFHGRTRGDPPTGPRPGGHGGARERAFSEQFFRNLLNVRRRKAGATGSPEDTRADSGARAAATYSVTVTFEEACQGSERNLKMGAGKLVRVRIPPGCEDGTVLRIKGQGRIEAPGEPRGDGFVRVSVEAHRLFRRQGLDIYLDVPVSLPEAILGARISVPTLGADVLLSVPPGSTGGRTLRLRGRGIALDGRESGDFYAVLRLVMPDEVDDELQNFFRSWVDRHDYDVRREWR